MASDRIMVCMKYIKHAWFAVALVMLTFGFAVWAAPVHTDSDQVRWGSFVETLIDYGIIPEHMANKAREVLGLVERLEVQEQSQEGPMNADKVSVRASQLINVGNLTFEYGEDVKGLLLLVKNESEADIDLEAKRGCQVIYRVYNADGNELYDSSSESKCDTNEKVTYRLNAGQTRMFPVTHYDTSYRLEKGTYRVLIDYPGYGSGERTIVVE